MLKRIGIGVGIFVGLIVVAMAALFFFFPKQWAIQEAEKRIEEATQRDLAIGGEVNLTFWPALGFSAEQASLSNPEGFEGDTPFIAADRIVFAVAVMPLLHGDIQVKQLIFDGAQVNLRARPDGVANWTFPTEENSENPTTIEDLRLDEVRLNGGRISFEGAQGEPLVLSDVDGSLALESLDQPASLESAFDYRGRRLSVDATIGAPRAVMEKGQTPISAQIASDALRGDFDGAFNAANGALAGQLAAEGGSLRQLMSWMGSPMGEGPGFGAFRVQATMSQVQNVIELTNATFGIDSIQARGNLTLTTQESGRMHVAGALSAPSVDLNTYLPPPPQGTEGGVETSAAWPSDPLDLTGLRALDANLNLAIGALKFQQLNFSNVTMAMRIANGALDARLPQIALYGGTGTARMIADGSGATPRIAVELDTQNIQAEPLLTDAIGLDKITGRGRLATSVVGQGASMAAIMRSLRGNAAFTFNDGQWKGVNLAAIARTIQAVMTGTPAGAGGGTDFAEMSATFQIAEGVAATNNLRMLNPYVRLEGQGLIDIGQQTIDMRVAPRAVNSIEGQGGNAGIGGLGIPFRVSGPWSRVSFQPDLGNVVQNELQRRMSGILGQNQNNPLAQLGGSLFGQQPTTTQTPATPATTTTPANETPQQRRQRLRREREQQEQQQQNPLGNILGNVLGGQQKQKQPNAPTP
jgi:AsmA protein